jgi:hypothetical protein
MFGKFPGLFPHQPPEILVTDIRWTFRVAGKVEAVGVFVIEAHSVEHGLFPQALHETKTLGTLGPGRLKTGDRFPPETRYFR